MGARLSGRILPVLILGLMFVASAAGVRSVGAGSQRTGQASLGRKVGEVPAQARGENLTGYMTTGQNIRMLMSFRPRHQAALQRMLKELYDPDSPLYHQWLSAQEYGARFGRSDEEFNHVVTWLQQQGMTVDRPYANKLAIGFTGTVDSVQRAFKVQMATYWDSANNRAFFSNTAPAVVPPEIDAITVGLTGLNNAVLYHKPLHRDSLVPLTPREKRQLESRITPSGTVGGFLFLLPNDLALLYDYKPLWNNGITGQGQKVGIVIDSDISNTDMSTYRTDAGLGAANVQRVLFNGFSNPGLTGSQDEAELDAESISATAPSAEIDLVLIPQLDSISIETVEQDIVNQGTIHAVNESFGICESESYSTGESSIFDQAAAAGIGFFASAGDEGAACDENNITLKGVECPACYPNVTGVGGTTVNANFDSQGNVTSRASETVWNTSPGVRLNCTGGSTGGGAGGGGVASIAPMPAYQQNSQGFSGGVPGGSKRYVPDIAAIGEPGPVGALFLFQGNLFYGGGTSQSSPLLAGMMALINQSKGSPQGSPNTALYTLGVSQYKNGGAKSFLDITSGNNNVAPVSPCLPSGMSGFSAGTGYDPVTGWGVPDLNVIVQNLGGSSSQYSGFLDGAGCDTIEGWAWDANNPGTTVSVDIYDGTSLVATAPAGLYREDLLNVLSSSNHGYSLATPASLKDGANHSVTVKIHGTSITLSGGPRTVHCTGGSSLQGALDGVGCDAISGWAWDSNDPANVVNVDLYDGTTLIATVTATLYRQDLQNVFGSPYHGFTFPAPASFKNGLSHTITAKFGGTSANLTWNNPQSFSCTTSTPNYQGSMDAANCTSITGYAWDTNNDRCTIDVAIYLDGAFQVVVPAQQSRAGVGNGYHGFSFAVPAAWKTGTAHSVLVRFSGTSTGLANSPGSLTCP